jgi:hypothetical protein
MGDTLAILALRRKRAHLADETEAAERQLAKQRTSLANLDAALLLFDASDDPTLIRAIRPLERSKYFRHAEQMRLALAAVRQAEVPLTARQVAVWAMLAKGLDADDDAIRLAITKQIRVALHRLAARGAIWRVGQRPSVWWGLPVVGQRQESP